MEHMLLEIFLASLLLGVFAGLSAGLFGIGGGALIVPLLSWLFAVNLFKPELVMLMAVATSLATAVFSSAASARTHHKLGNIAWKRVYRMSPGLLLGAVSGTLLAKFISADQLRWYFIVYLLYTCQHMAISSNQPRKSVTSGYTLLDYPVSVFIGVLSAIIGIGGGTMTVPYLMRNGLQIKKAVAISSACAVPIAVSGSLSYTVLGWQQVDLPEGSFGFIYWPAFLGIVLTSVFTAVIGAKWANKLPAQRLKRYFAVLLALIALKMANF
jgi:uncharacterized membrane protein YfcA